VVLFTSRRDKKACYVQFFERTETLAIVKENKRLSVELKHFVRCWHCIIILKYACHTQTYMFSVRVTKRLHFPLATYVTTLLKTDPLFWADAQACCLCNSSGHFLTILAICLVQWACFLEHCRAAWRGVNPRSVTQIVKAQLCWLYEVNCVEVFHLFFYCWLSFGTTFWQML